MNIYTIALLVAVFETALLVHWHHKNIIPHRLLFFIFGIVANFGCSVISTTDSLETALMGNLIFYIGGFSCCICMIIVVCDICKVNMSHIWTLLLMGIEFFVLILVVNVPNSDLYYRNVEIGHLYGMSVLIKERGPLYAITAVYILGASAIDMAITIYSIQKKNSISILTAQMIIAMQLASTVTYFVPRLLGFRVDLTSIAYVIDMAFLLVIFVRADMYNMEGNLFKIFNQREEYGYLCFDKNKKFMGASSALYRQVPELVKQRIDFRFDLSKFEKQMAIDIVEWAEAWIDGKEDVPTVRKFSQNGKYWDATIHELTASETSKKVIGYLVEFHDDTKDMQYINQIEHARELIHKSLSERLEVTESAMQQDRIMRHDRRHFEAMLMSLMQDKKYDEAEALLEERLVNEPRSSQRFCDNTTVNAAIGYYTHLAQARGIAMELNLNIPSSLKVDELELAITIGNLIENAIHGCESIEESKRYIQVKAMCHEQLLLEISNSCDKDVKFDENGYPIARKKGHGVGTESIVNFVNKADGTIAYSLNDNVFKVRMILDI